MTELALSNSTSRATRRTSAFTLNEMLVVVSIVVLMMTLALPAFNVLSGSKSAEAATNQISAVLGQARSEAIGVQEIRGVMFYIDPSTGRTNMAMVRDSGYQNSASPNIVYLDLVADRDFTALPNGVGVQTIDNAAGSPRTDDGYIGYNVTGAFPTQYGGIILFDAYGKLISVQCGFRCSSNPVSVTGAPTPMASLLLIGEARAVGAGTYTDFAIPGNTFSQIGLMVYQTEQFTNLGYTIDDPQINGTAYSTEVAEETWLDNNGSLVLINRYNGTLIKGE